MATSVDCDIVSAEESIFEGKVEFISLTGTLGELGIYPGHTPLLSEVKPGPVRLRMESGEEDIFYVSGGFLEHEPKKSARIFVSRLLPAIFFTRCWQ